ncbi:MAG: transketolase [Vicinamibacteria bacterium]
MPPPDRIAVPRGNVSARRLRRIILDQSKRANVGHIGSALSVADILAALYSGILRVGSPEDPERDRFILSKGHAALALYGALHLAGFFDAETLNTFCADGSLLGVHPEHALRGVDFSTGSLGHGLSMGAGAALGARLQGSSRRVFVLLSDAELNEGSLWEAVMFAAHHSLSNLVALVDCNGQQALGYTDEVLSLPRLPERFRAFGWDAHEVDGHDTEALRCVLSGLEWERDTPPHVLIARTTFGKGVSFMEGRIHWHYWPMSDQEHRSAVDEVEAGGRD